MYKILSRLLEEINTDPQRRCYWGCHAKSELVWTPWEELDELKTMEKAEKRMTFWQELNDYAVSERGKVGTQKEYKVVEVSEIEPEGIYGGTLECVIN